MFKLVIIGVLIVILWSLGSALFYMTKSNHDPKKMAKALTMRIGLSFALFLAIVIAMFMGWIEPHDMTLK